MTRKSSSGGLPNVKAYLLTLTGHTNKVIDALKLRAPEAWQRLCKAVAEERITEPDVENAILQATRSLFPGIKLVQVADLLIRMMDIVREEFDVSATPTD